jgi:hypothetical protein
MMITLNKQAHIYIKISFWNVDRMLKFHYNSNVKKNWGKWQAYHSIWFNKVKND